MAIAGLVTELTESPLIAPSYLVEKLNTLFYFKGIKFDYERVREEV